MSKAKLAFYANEWKVNDIAEKKTHELVLQALRNDGCNGKNSCARNMMIGIFFDGTGNSHYIAYPKTHSNVARLFFLHSNNVSEYNHSIYLQGVGTVFKEIDDYNREIIFGKVPQGAALGYAGMKRINYAYIEILNKISSQLTRTSPFKFVDLMKLGMENRAKLSKAESPGVLGMGISAAIKYDTNWKQQNFHADLLDELLSAEKMTPLLRQMEQKILTGDNRKKIGSINLAVFGFSRGAAEARAFLVHFDKVFPGRKIAGFPVNIYFAGLFDTVSSVGLVDVFDSNLSFLDGFYSWAKKAKVEGKHVKECYHFVALNEVRACFPLTALNYFKQGRQFAYPGAHSDVGGGYGEKHQGKTDISVVAGRHMYYLARKAGVPLMNLEDALKSNSSKAKSSAQAFNPNDTVDKAFDSFLGKLKTAVSQTKLQKQDEEYDLDALAKIAHNEYLKHRGYILNSFQERRFYKDSSPSQKKHLDTINDHVKKMVSITLEQQYQLYVKHFNSTKLHYRYKDKKIDIKPYSKQVFAQRINPPLSVVQQAQSLKNPPSLHAFYSDYVHDSVASFIEMGMNEPAYNNAGILKYRRIYDDGKL